MKKKIQKSHANIFISMTELCVVDYLSLPKQIVLFLICILIGNKQHRNRSIWGLSIDCEIMLPKIARVRNNGLLYNANTSINLAVNIYLYQQVMVILSVLSFKF